MKGRGLVVDHIESPADYYEGPCLYYTCAYYHTIVFLNRLYRIFSGENVLLQADCILFYLVQLMGPTQMHVYQWDEADGKVSL